MKEDRYLSPGTKVRLDSLVNDEEELKSEYGVVVHCWLDKDIGVFICYVAFFGHAFPKEKPEEQSYILRYAAISLTAVAD
jgi:hypothetical protein